MPVIMLHLGPAASGMERKAARQQVQRQAGLDGIGTPRVREPSQEALRTAQERPRAALVPVEAPWRPPR